MFVKTGTYTGDGGSTNAVTGLGFPPCALIVKATATTGTMHLAIEVAGTTHVKAGNLAAGWDSQGTITLDADGFTLTNNNGGTNGTGVAYAYVAFGDVAADCGTFTFTGDGTDNRNVGALAFQPDLAFVISAGTDPTRWRSDQLSGDLSQNLESKAGANRIAGFHSAGITVGTQYNVNTEVYYVLCFKKAAAVLATAEYTGTAADDRDIAHGLTATPIFTIVQQQVDQSSPKFIMRFSSQAGDLSSAYNAAEAANLIQAVDGTNITVGTSDYVNALDQTFTIVTFGLSEAAPAGGANGSLLLLGVGT